MLDGETGNYYYGARYYDPKWSIWLGVDPLAEQYPSWSSYNYTLNNPIQYVDPDGNAPQDWYENIFTGKVTWKEGTAYRIGYRRLGYTWAHTDADGNRLEMNGNTKQITYNGKVLYDYNSKKLRGGFAFSDGGNSQSPSSLDKGERDTQWFDMGGGMGALLAIFSFKLKPFNFSKGKGSNGGKPTFEDKIDDGINAVDFGTEAVDEVINDTTITTRRAVRIEPLSETAKMGIIEDVEVTIPHSKVDSVRQTDKAGLKRQLDELQR